MRPFFDRTHALSHLKLCLARTSHARVLFTWSHLAPPALQNSQYVPHFTRLNKRNNLMLNSSLEYLQEDKKCCDLLKITWIPPRWQSFCFILKLFYWFFSQKCGRTCAGSTNSKKLACTHFARTIGARLRTLSHPRFRTHACDRTHARTHAL